MARQGLSAVFEGPGRMSLREFDLPRIGPDDGLLKVEAAGICGTDASYWLGKKTPGPTPRVLGHENIGRVEEIGERLSQASGVSKGDRVSVETMVPCGACRSCLTGVYKFCTSPTRVRYGVGSPITRPPAIWGSYGQYMYLAPGTVMHKVSEDVPLEAAVLINAVIANGIQWTRMIAQVSIGHTVVVQGAGPQGMAQVIAAAASGAFPIIATGLSCDEHRLRLTKEFGAHYTIDAEKEDVVKRVTEITNGEMADVVVDVTGSSEALVKSVDLVRPGGTLVNAGHQAAPAIVPDKITTREIRFQGVTSKGYEAVLAAVKLTESRKYPLEKIVTHRFPLEQVYEAMQVASGQVPGTNHIKVVLVP